MSRTTKRFLSIMLAAAMILSLGISGWAIDDEIIVVEPEVKTTAEKDSHVTDAFDGGTELGLEEIDPSTLDVPMLGEINEEEIVIDSADAPEDLNEVVRVSIVLNRPATMAAGYSAQNIAENKGAMSYRQSLRQQQAGVEAAIASAGVSMDVKWNLTLAVNAISANVRRGDIDTILGIPGVSDVWLETRYEPQVDEVNTGFTTEYMVGATEVWASGYTGAGTRVAIIDTGTDYEHQSFDPEALEYALEQDGLTPELLTWDEISAVASELNAPVSQQVYRNTKIPYAYNYVDGNYVTNHVNDTQGEHGSHVSGIAAANRYVKIDGEFVNAAEAVKAVGVAPDAQILTMKVFGAGGGAYDSDYMVAIEDAIVLKADSVNLSLGSAAPGFTFSDGYQDVMDSLVECGTVVSISAGNSYNWAEFLPSGIPYLYLEDISLHTGGSPGSFVNSLGVAAAQNVGSVYAPLYFGDLTIVYTETDGYKNARMTTIAGTHDFVLIDGPGVDDNGHVGQEGDAFAALGPSVLSGKIAICYRGTSSFFAKANAAAAQGAIGVIIINNQPGTIPMNMTGYTYTAPVVSILQTDGEALKAGSQAVTGEDGSVLYYTGSIEVSKTMLTSEVSERSEATITDFSSWGVPGSLIMKPEITAPGGGIYSVFGSSVNKDGIASGGPDLYEYMSGTSMAAPHVAGMAALLSQYIRENKLDELTGQNSRTLINSLLMSTATPMIVDGAYLPVLQQGSGLGDTFIATRAKSFIMMGEDATASWADGKVKVELGQDAARAGEYSYSFAVNNFSETDLAYELRTDMFTQAPTYYNGNFYMLTDTMDLAEGEDFSVSYAYPNRPLSGHDVNKDGATDRADAQAILDYLTGKVDGAELDLEAGEMDGVEGLSSYDAQLLLTWEEENGIDDLVVPAGESVTVTVSIAYTDELKEFLDYYYVNGAWIEGFTYVNPISNTKDGEILDVQHSIPILGFYGSFTDASMYDCVDPISAAYGSTKTSYTGNSVTNYLTVDYGKGETIFMGNPYAVEEEFPTDRLAVNSSTKLVNFKYNLIRNAGTTGWLVLDDSLDVIASGAMTGNTIGAYYYVNGSAWQNTGIKTAKIASTAGKLGLAEGDSFLIGEFAVPEYYGMMLHPGENINTVTEEEIAQLLADGELGAGSCIGFFFTVDDETPTISSVKLSDDKTKISVTAQDDNYLAYVAIVDLAGKVFVGEVPEQTEPGEEVTITFDIADLGLDGAVAAFAADYAANEEARLVRLSGEGPVPVEVEGVKSYYRPVDKLVNYGDYLMVSSNAAGDARAMATANNDTVAATGLGVTIVDGTVDDYTGLYIDGETVPDTIRWTAGETSWGFTFESVANGGWLYLGVDEPPASIGAEYADYATPWTYENYQLNCLDLYVNYPSLYLTWNNGQFFCATTESDTHIYLFERVEYKTTTTIEIDPDNASSVTVYPEELILMAGETAELKATVEPMVLPDKSVTWSSADESVATVDENGVVTGVANGETQIIATSVTTPEVFGTATVKVLEPEPMDARLFAQVLLENEKVQFVGIDLNDMSTTDYSNGNIFSFLFGGGVSGSYLYGNDVDLDFHRYNWSEGFSYDSAYHWEIAAAHAVIDGACAPAFTISDYTNVDTSDESTDNDEPTVLSFPFCFASMNDSSTLYLWVSQTGAYRLNLSSIANFTAFTFAGYFTDDDGTPNLIYFALADDGALYYLDLYPTTAGGLRVSRLKFAQVQGMLPAEDLSAYSLSYYEDDDTWGVFIADGSLGGIYYADFNELSSYGAAIDAHFIGLVENAAGLSTLSNMSFDTASDLGNFDIKPAEGNGGSSVTGFEADARLVGLPVSAEILQAEEVEFFDGESSEDVGFEPVDDDIVIGESDGDDIEIVGGLNAARTQSGRRTIVRLDAAVLENPEYAKDDHVEISITTPDGEEFFNGFATLAYDPEALTFVELDPNSALELTSFTVDEEAGLIKFAYASTEFVEAGAVASVIFSLPTEDTVVTATTLEANDELDIGEKTEIELMFAGYLITIEDYTKAKAKVDGIADQERSRPDSEGKVTFTIDVPEDEGIIADQAVLVAVRKTAEDEESIEVVPCVEDENGKHSFTITVEEDTTVTLAFKGDADLNGVVEGKDGTIVKRVALETYEFKEHIELCKLISDVNGNNEIEGKDGTMICRAAIETYKIRW